MDNREMKVELALPFKAEFVSVARLTVAGIASRMGFDIETIEDIKVALAEVCNKIVTHGSDIADCFRITYRIKPEGLTVDFNCSDKSLKGMFDKKDELGMSIIEALMDKIDLDGGDSYLLSMLKEI